MSILLQSLPVLEETFGPNQSRVLLQVLSDLENRLSRQATKDDMAELKAVLTVLTQRVTTLAVSQERTEQVIRTLAQRGD